ncbi:DUF4422 domain-containing protein [Bifidobacterium oedipodis]|uniref:Family 8 glycosyl transferase n=1 Tax=Bifidobacterium oedipodis TaxID=2675322 RepID=A0A7Y0ERH4_9BIFI|nr:DUF4422 domain-containing protein [Bifidobacterium sp. DSM 109957]NMM95091.1 family 8 glycosyl transferase [Bifidobacterium sp. DSM 109957]
MLKISIIIAAYNVETYIKNCLDSVSAQTYSNIEAIVVNDASTDGTAAIINKAADADPRIIVVNHEQNKGLHLTRKTGVEHATGQYAFFLDGDDDLDPHMCEQLAKSINDAPTDILHFGLTVIGENGILDDECQAFEQFNNAPTHESAHGDIVRDIYLESRGYRVDWRVTQRLFRTALLKRAFKAMTSNRLERAEDGYECLVISAMAAWYSSAKQCRGYRYHYGRGVTGTNTISAATFSNFCRQFQACFDATDLFVADHPELDLDGCAAGFRHKAIELLGNDWKTRVTETDKAEAAQAMSTIMGSAVTAREVWRHVRDLAWKLITSKQQDANDLATLRQWSAIAGTINVTDGSAQELVRYGQTKSRAEELLSDLSRASEKQQYADQPIRIFVTTHKNVDKPASAILQPVQVGLKSGSYRFPWAFQDDEGDNISAKNPMYCELTTQYWAWKNVDADYYGFCHYRRYFDFSDTEHEENPYGEVMDDYIDADAIREYGLDDDTMRKVIAGCDVITTRYGDLTKIIDKHDSPKGVWFAADKLHNADLRRCYEILCRMHPDYRQDADAFLDGNRSCFCNMFIMRKQIFQDYCAWLFPILEEFERQTDMSTYSKEALRTPGHLSERLLNIYLMHHQRTGSNWRTKELQCVHFTNPEPEQRLRPLWEHAPELARPVPVVFAADDNYVPQLATTIYSAMKNASRDRFYDVVVLQRNITWDKQERLRDFFSQFSNMSLRFTDVDRMMSGYTLSTNNPHISVETYYRFLIQELLPFYDKVLYLDSDIIINGNIAELYDTELGDTLLGAVRDIDFLGNLNVKGGKRMEYAKTTLRMRNPYDYFQAGVLVLNTKAMRERYTIEQWLNYASDPDLIYNDQDVLNAHCQGKVTYLPWEWNVVHDLDNRVGRIFALAPNARYEEYLASRSNPRIIHYAGYIKPWTDPDCDFASIYWRYARETPFYERLLKRVSAATVRSFVPPEPKDQHQRAIGDANPLRKLIDPIAPLGSNRRELLKSVGRMVRGRK